MSDLIDRGALKNYILDNPELLFTGYEDSLLSVHDVLWQIDQQPTIDAVPVVHGKWAVVEDADEFWGMMKYFKCSVCGKITYGKSNYCQNCGAKMDKEE